MLFRESIWQYELDEIVSLIRWIRSDGRLRTDDEIVDKMVRELGSRAGGTESFRRFVQQSDRRLGECFGQPHMVRLE